METNDSIVEHFVHQVLSEAVTSRSASLVPSQTSELEVVRRHARSIVQFVLIEAEGVVLKSLLPSPRNEVNNEHLHFSSQPKQEEEESNEIKKQIEKSHRSEELLLLERQKSMDLDNQLSFLQEKVSQLQAKLLDQQVSHEEENKQHETSIAEWKSKYRDVFEELEVAKSRASESEEEVKRMVQENKDNIRKARQEIELRKKEGSQIRLKFDMSSKELTSMREKEDQYRKKVAAAEQEAANKTHQYEVLLQNLKDEKKRHHAEASKREAELEALQKRLREHDEVAQKKLMEVKSYYLRREEQIMLDIEAAKPELNEMAMQTEPDPQEAKNAMKMLSIETRLKRANSEALDHADTIRNLKERCDSLESINEQTMQESQAIKTEMLKVQDTHTYLTLRLEAANREIENATADGNQLRLQAEKNHFELQDCQKENHRLQEVILEQKASMESITTEKERLRDVTKRLRTSVTVKNEELSCLSAELDTIKRVLSEASIDLSKLLEMDEKERRERQSEDAQEQKDFVEEPAIEPSSGALAVQKSTSSLVSSAEGGGATSPVGVKGIRYIKSRNHNNNQNNFENNFNTNNFSDNDNNNNGTGRQGKSKTLRPASAPGRDLQCPKKKLARGRKRRNRCNECKRVFEGKGRVLPSNSPNSTAMTAQSRTHSAGHFRTMTPDALIQSYLDSGYPTLHRSTDYIFCSWKCAKEWNQKYSHAIVKQRTEELICREEEAEGS